MSTSITAAELEAIAEEMESESNFCESMKRSEASTFLRRAYHLKQRRFKIAAYACRQMAKAKRIKQGG